MSRFNDIFEEFKKTETGEKVKDEPFGAGVTVGLMVGIMLSTVTTVVIGGATIYLTRNSGK